MINPIKSFTVPSNPYNKVSMQHYYIVAPPPFPIKIVPPLPCLWLVMQPQMVTLKYPPTSLLLQIPNPRNMTNMTRHHTYFPLTTSLIKQISMHSPFSPPPLP